MNLENIKINNVSEFENLEIGGKVELLVQGKWKSEIFVGFNEWYIGCKPNYKRTPTTIYETESGDIIERKILDYNILKQDPRIISERAGDELKKINPSSELSSQYKKLLEAQKWISNL